MSVRQAVVPVYVNVFDAHDAPDAHDTQPKSCLILHRRQIAWTLVVLAAYDPFAPFAFVSVSSFLMLARLYILCLAQSERAAEVQYVIEVHFFNTGAHKISSEYHR